MPRARAREPVRLIQTTLTHQGRSASFVWAEGLGRGALIKLRRKDGPLHDPKALTGSRLDELVIVHFVARCIEAPYTKMNAPLEERLMAPEPKWIEALLGSKQIVITGSPPRATSFRSLVPTARGVVIGAWLGYEVGLAIGSPMLTFVLVPFGMLVCGPTAGIARALETGLEQWLTERMKPRFTRTKPKPKARQKARTLVAEDGSKLLSEDGRTLVLEHESKKRR